MRLTERQIKSAKAVHSDIFLGDGRGLYLRARPVTNTKTWLYRYRNTLGKQTWLELGNYPALALHDARTKALQAKAERKNGLDPRAVREKVREDALTALAAGQTFQTVATEYYERVIAKRFRRPEQFKARLERDALPELGRKRLQDITRGDVSRTLNAIVDRGSRVMANRVLNDLKQVFRYAVSQGHIPHSPAELISRRDVGGKEESVSRALTLDEIEKVLRVLRAESIPDAKRKISWQIRELVMLLLLTGQRVGETLLARWDHVDFKTKSWNIPPENTKIGRAHVVHLSAQSLALLRRLKPLSYESGWLFVSDKREEQPITVRAVNRAINRMFDADEVGRRLEIPHFSTHDLRRTVATRLADMGIQPHVIERLLNHAVAGVAGIYNRSEQLPERAEALQMWGKKIGVLCK